MNGGEPDAVPGAGIERRDRRATDESLRLLEQRELQLADILRAAAMGSWQLDVATGRIDWSDEALAVLGTSRAELGSTTEQWQRFLDPADAAGSHRAVQAALAGGETYWLEYRFRRPGAEQRWIEAHGRVVRDRDGRPARMVGVVRDVTARRRAQERSRFLAEAGEILASSLDYEETLAQVARLAVPELADWCGVDVVGPAGEIEQVAVGHVDPEKAEWARELRRREPVEPDAPTGVANVLRTREAEIYPEISDEMLVAAARDDEQLALLSGLGMSSVMIVPLIARDQAIGAISLIAAESGRRYDEEDLATATELARRAATAVDNARLFRAEQEGREALEHVLTIAPSFHTASPEELAESICTGAVEAFGSAAASLWEVDGDAVCLVARSTPTPYLPVGTRLSIEQVPGIRDGVMQRRAAFIEDSTSHGPTDIGDYAARQGVGSALLVPIGTESTVKSMLSFTWRETIAPPSPGWLAAAQRFADQAGLALENARRLAAQREAEALTAALDRLLDLTPSFRGAAGSLEQVARAIADAALETFDCDTATVWQLAGDGLRALWRSPGTPDLAPGAVIPLQLYDVGELLAPRATFVEDVPRRWPRAAARLGKAAARDLVRIPLMHGEAVDGLLTLNWTSATSEPSAGMLAVMQRFGDQAALSLEEARLRAVSDEAAGLHAQLEANLLPAPRVGDPRVAVSTLYRPGEHRMLLGGDFVDVLDLPDGRLALLIGDVSGRGPSAAALGATLRAAWRALILSGDDLGRVLAGMDAVLVSERSSPETFATVAVGLIDWSQGRLCVAVAGHPPPILLDGDIAPAAVPPAPPLGVHHPPVWPTTEIEVPEAFGLLLYTDGLVEGRNGGAGAGRLGLDGLTRILQDLDHGTSPEAIVGEVFARAREANGGEMADDVALLLLRCLRMPSGVPVEPPAPGLVVRLALPAEAASVPRVRHELVALCDRLGCVSETRDAVALAVTEAVTNVLMHAYVGADVPDPGVEIEAWPEGERLRVLVRDFGHGMRPRADSPGLGLGLSLIGTFSEEFDVRSDDEGSTEVVMLFRAAPAPFERPPAPSLQV